jgi:hypothetical protein
LVSWVTISRTRGLSLFVSIASPNMLEYLALLPSAYTLACIKCNVVVNTACDS